MDYTLMPSLKSRALVKIAVTLFNQNRNMPNIAILMYSSAEISLKKVVHIIIEKVLDLQLPELLQQELSNFVGAVCWEDLLWQRNHLLYLGEEYLVRKLYKLCWTPLGTVDKKKTAEILVKDSRLCVLERYKLACIYCLEESIHILWEEMSPFDKNKVKDRHMPRLDSFWAHFISGEMAALVQKLGYNVSPYKYAFVISANNGNDVAASYFFKKLTPEEKRNTLLISTVNAARKACFHITDFCDVLFFLLSKMDKEQQIEVFQKCPQGVLLCLLQWPWQYFFIEIAKHIRTFLSKEDCCCILEKIIDKFTKGYRDYNYQKLFGLFWQQIPTTHKDLVIDKFVQKNTLYYFFNVEDKENIKLILRDATSLQRQKLLSSIFVFPVGKHPLYCNYKWNVLESCFQEYIQSEEKMMKFKEVYKKLSKNYTTRECVSKRKRLAKASCMWHTFFQENELIEKDEKKRSVGEMNSTLTKRLCSIEAEK